MNISDPKQSEIMLRFRVDLIDFATKNDLNSVLRKTLDDIGELVSSPIGFYHFLEPDQKTLTLQAWSTRTLQEFCQAEGEGLHYPVASAGVWADCIRSREAIVHNDFASVENRRGFPEGHSPIIRQMVVPIFREGNIVAILGVGNKSTNYTKSDLELVAYYADVAWEVAEKKQNEEKMQQKILELDMLHQIDCVIISNSSPDVAYKSILKVILTGTKYDAGRVLDYNPGDVTFSVLADLGFSANILKNAFAITDKGYVEKVVLTRDVLEINAAPHKYLGAEEDEHKAYLGLPLIAEGELRGVMELFAQEQVVASLDEIKFIKALATQTAISLQYFNVREELANRNVELRDAYDLTIEGWGKTLEMKDKDTEGHSQRVTEMTVALAKACGLSADAVIQVRRGALLHDIGKMGIPDSILLKPGPLNDEEWEVMRSHPQVAYDYLKDIPFLAEALAIPYSHHEKWDGTGYPQGLRGKEIPIFARLFAIVDAYDALSSDRPYRKAWSEEDIVAYIRGESGKHFDPEIVEVFLNNLSELKK